jgi:hypothetical protein
VLGLRKLGDSMNKLMEMKKDDDALTPQERSPFSSPASLRAILLR